VGEAALPLLVAIVGLENCQQLLQIPNATAAVVLQALEDACKQLLGFLYVGHNDSEVGAFLPHEILHP